MSYPGNASLAPEIQERILNTFTQTLDLAAEGNHQEAVLGCDFILRLDPDFAPAKTLLDRLGDGDGAVDVADLRATAAGALLPAAAPDAGGEPEAEDPFDSFELELPELPEAEPTSEGQSGLEAALRELLKRREPRRLIEVAGENKEEVAADPGLRKLVEAAYSQLESEPYVSRFLDQARQAMQEGNAVDAAGLVEKARSLDPNHPGIAELEKAQGFYADPARRMGTRRTAAAAREAKAGDRAGTRPGVGRETPAAPPSPAAGAAPAASPQSPPPPQPAADAESPFGLGFDTTDAFETEGPAPAARGGDDRIGDLLAQGQTAFDKGDYQTAIDAWSRIFLIDIDHEEAARRIEEARRLKAEGERRVEEIFHEAVNAFDSGDRSAALDGFRRVVSMQPNHLAAREYIEQIEGGGDAAPGLQPTVAEPLPLPPPPPGAEPLSEEEKTASGILQQEILVPPEPGASRQPAAPAVPRPAAAAAAGKSLKSFVYVGGAVLVLILALGYLALDQWDNLFPNSTPETPEVAPPPDPVLRATRLFEDGRLDAAIRQLEELEPGHPRYQRAQELLVEWRALAETVEPEGPPPPSPEEAARRERALTVARQAHAQKEFLIASRYFERAAEILPLEEEDKALYEEAQRQLEPLQQQIELFEDNSWEYVLPALWNQHENEPDNRDVIRLIVDSYYNLGVRDLQRAQPTEAVEKFEAALELAPDDSQIQRHLLFAEAYGERSKDLLYWIYTKYLPFR